MFVWKFSYKNGLYETIMFHFLSMKNNLFFIFKMVF